MGKQYKKWWRINDIPVEFVDPGVDPATARRQYGYRQTWGKKPKPSLNFEAVIAIISSIVLVLGGGWWFIGRDNPVQASESVPTATAVVLSPQTPTPTQTPARTPYIRAMGFTPTPTVTATPTATPTTTPTPTPQTLSPVFESPVQRVVVVTATPTATPTRAPHAYEIIANYSQPEPLYSFISGWIVERDGTTPRPVGIEVRYPTGSMMYPRPNNTDIANGHYEFMVSPGEYDIRILDGDAPSVHISVAENTRYEVSFRYTGSNEIVTPARSNPWVSFDAQPTPTSTPTSTPTPKAIHHIYLPLVQK